MEMMVEEGFLMPAWALIPFVLMLLTIAISPLIMGTWWARNRHKLVVALFLGIPTAVLLINKGLYQVLENQIVDDYFPFIVLLGALFVIAGGIHLSGDIMAKPSVNTLFLLIGFVLASLMGTTGAAMLLIRPLLSTNQHRQYKTHTILFFIAIVANCGGLLTPLGDPPLFLLYLRGAQFTWFFNLAPEWLFTGGILLVLYYFTDRYYFKKEPWQNISAELRQTQALRVGGSINFILLLGVVLSVAFINETYIPQMTEPNAPLGVRFLREIVLILLIVLSLYATKPKVRALNHFNWHPFIEVAVVFFGIFITMTPALIYLNQNAAHFGLDTPAKFYYATGALSSVLDNAPTALALHGVAKGLVASGQAIAEVAGIPEILLKAISTAAVFFGAMTYIGNGPNFMVKSIAEAGGVKMPSFFGYMLKFSLIILLPLYILNQLLFL